MIIFNLSNLSTRSPSHNTQKITRLAGGLQFEMRVVRVWVWFCILILIIIWFFWHWELVIQMMTYWAKKLDILSLNKKDYKEILAEKKWFQKSSKFSLVTQIWTQTWVGRISKGRNAVPLKNIANGKYPDSNYLFDFDFV